MEKLFRIRCSQIGKIMGNAKTPGELSAGCKTYLKEWYANDSEQISSKYINKGNDVEDDLINFMAETLGYGMAEKNYITNSDEYFCGTCDVNLPDCIVDVKASWNRKTFQEQMLEPINSDYEWQLQGYMHLYNKPKAKLFYGLMNTPETNYSEEVIFEDMPVNERWFGYGFDIDYEKIKLIKAKVDKCREFLKEYESQINARTGKLITL